MSPTERSLAECRKRGWVAQVVERWNPHAHIRQDMFGCIDIVACVPQRRCQPDALGLCMNCERLVELYCTPCRERPGHVLGIQATSGDNHAARVAKIKAEPRMKAWCEAGGRVEVWSWSKRGARGERKVWTLRVEEVVL